MWGRVRSLARAILGRKRFESEMDEELRFHVERYAEDLERAGTARAEALRQARLEFGQLSSIKEDCRQPLGLLFVERLLQDVRYATRTLRVSTS